MIKNKDTRNFTVIRDENDNKIIVINDIIFKGKRMATSTTRYFLKGKI